MEQIHISRISFSATNEILKIWGKHLGTLLDLHRALQNMDHRRALAVLDTYVASQHLGQITYYTDVDNKFKTLSINKFDINSVPPPPYQSNEFQQSTSGIPVANEIQRENQTTSSSVIKKPLTQVEMMLIGGEQKRVGTENSDDSAPISNFGNNSPLLTLSSMAPLSIPRFLFNDIERGTEIFSKQNLLGNGRFGAVFKAIIRNKTYAIRDMSMSSSSNSISEDNYKSFFEEVELLNRYAHQNIIHLCGICEENNFLGFVFEYMALGSLYKLLHSYNNKTSILSLQDRVKVLHGVSEGLLYLHTARTGQPLIHGSIKSSNILLDENKCPKLSDFGLARHAQKSDSGSTMLTHVTSVQDSTIFQSQPYLPDEFIRDYKLTVKTDIYGFGLVIFESLTNEELVSAGKKPSHLKDAVHSKFNSDKEKYVQELVNIVSHLSDDRQIEMNKWNRITVDTLLQLGMHCTMEKFKRLSSAIELRNRLNELVTTLPLNNIVDEMVPVSVVDFTSSAVLEKPVTDSIVINKKAQNNNTDIVGLHLELNNDNVQVDNIVKYHAAAASNNPMLLSNRTQQPYSLFQGPIPSSSDRQLGLPPYAPMVMNGMGHQPETGIRQGILRQQQFTPASMRPQQFPSATMSPQQLPSASMRPQLFTYSNQPTDSKYYSNKVYSIQRDNLSHQPVLSNRYGSVQRPNALSYHNGNTLANASSYHYHPGNTSTNTPNNHISNVSTNARNCHISYASANASNNQNNNASPYQYNNVTANVPVYQNGNVSSKMTPSYLANYQLHESNVENQNEFESPRRTRQSRELPEENSAYSTIDEIPDDSDSMSSKGVPEHLQLSFQLIKPHFQSCNIREDKNDSLDGVDEIPDDSDSMSNKGIPEHLQLPRKRLP